MKAPRFIASAGIISAATLASRVLGLAREMMAARLFGVGPVWDAFALAFQMPNLFRRLFGEGALSAAFLPVFSEALAKRTATEAFRFMSAVLTLLAVLLSGVALLAWAGTYALPSLVSPAEAWKASLFCRLLRIMLPYLPLICLVALVSSILHCFKHFALPALASVMLNVCWIGGFWVAVKVGGGDEERQVTIVAWSIVVGGVLELLMQIPALRAHGVRYRPNLDHRDPGVREVLRLMGPTVFGLAVVQINLVLDSVIAEALVPGDGAVSALYFGNRLMQFPLALIGIAIAQAVFPYFAERAAHGDTAGLREQVGQALRIVLFGALPASVGLVVLTTPIIELFLQWGKFSAQYTERTAWVVICYSLGVWAYCGNHVLTRAFYSLKDTRTPVRIGAWNVVLNVAMNLVLVWPLREAGLALATALSSVVNLVALCLLLERRVGEWAWRPIARTGALSLAASLAMGGACLGLLWALGAGGAGVAWRALRVAGPLGVGAAVYFGAAALLRMPEVALLFGGFLRAAPAALGGGGGGDGTTTGTPGSDGKA
ncbi:MAG: murein biosynthesis integral membrane protein MurJ [Planctomycetes bacterium]|nr:murein biosynthesis integral membrane protein MurJ [Planctomycetota bacterium]